MADPWDDHRLPGVHDLPGHAFSDLEGGPAADLPGDSGGGLQPVERALDLGLEDDIPLFEYV